MKYLIHAVIVCCSIASAAQTVVLTSTQLKDSAGVPVADGIATITPTLCNGQPTPYWIIGGGFRTQAPVPVRVVAGQFSVTLPDTAQTVPHICYSMTVQDRVYGTTLIGKGYDKMQPSATPSLATASWCTTTSGTTTCNLDNYSPSLVSVALPDVGYDALGAAALAQAASVQKTSNLSDLANMPAARANLGLGSSATQPASAFDAAGAAASVQASSSQKSSNLGDLSSVAAARANLGLGTAATQSALAFDPTGAASAAQSASMQKSANLGDLASAAIARTNLGLGTAATMAATSFDAAGAATSAQTAVQATSMQRAANLGDLASAAAARTNLGLGTAATQAATAFDSAGAATTVQAASVQKSANLSDLASASIARTNLGLGAAAIHGATITISGVPCSLDSTCTVAGGPGVSDGSIPAGTTGSDPVAAANTAVNQVITIGPSTPPQNTVIPLFPGSTIHDTRPGFAGDRYLDCLFQGRMHDVRAGEGSHCRWDHVTFDSQTNMAQNQQGLHFNTLWSYGASANYSSNWRTISLLSANVIWVNRGIANGYNLYYHHDAAGDVNLHNSYAWFTSGWKTPADEGFTGTRNTLIQNPTYWHGTSLSAGTGLTVPLLSDSTVASTSGEDNNTTIDGGYLIDISKGTISGTITGPAVPVPGSTYLWQLPTSLTNLPQITAWGTCASPITESTPAQSNQPVSCVATVAAGTFAAGGLVQIAGKDFAEQAPITAVSAKANGVQTLTLATRHRHDAGATVIQGGPALFFSADANLAATGMRTTYPTFGSLDGVNLIYGFYPQGSYHGDIPDCGKQAFCPGTTGRNGFHLYPGAEIAANLSLHHDPQLEPNSIVFSSGDLLESPEPDEINFNGDKIAVSLSTPPNGSESTARRTTVGGPGWVSNATAHLTLNTNNPAMYKQFGGLYDATPMHWVRGYFGQGFLFDLMPDNLVKVLNMGASQDAQLFSMPTGQVWWDNANHRFHTERLGSSEYLGPSTAPAIGSSCSTVPAGTWVFSQDGKASYCNGTVWTQPFALPTKIAPIVVALPTTAIAAGACFTGSAAMPGVIASGSSTPGTAFDFSFSGNLAAVAGYGSSSAFTFWPWPTADTFNFSMCNQTAASVTPGAAYLNVSTR